MDKENIKSSNDEEQSDTFKFSGGFEDFLASITSNSEASSLLSQSTPPEPIPPEYYIENTADVYESRVKQEDKVKENKTGNGEEGILCETEKGENFVTRIFYKKEGEEKGKIAYKELFVLSDPTTNKYLSFLYVPIDASDKKDNIKLLGFRFYEKGYEEADEGNYFTLLLQKEKELSLDTIKSNSNSLGLSELSRCKIFERSSGENSNEKYFSILERLFKNDLKGKGSNDIHGSSIKTLAFLATLEDGEALKKDYDSIFVNNKENTPQLISQNLDNIIKQNSGDTTEQNSGDTTEQNSGDTIKQKICFVLKPLNIEGHATVLLIDVRTKECYLFDSSLDSFRKLQSLIGTKYGNSAKLLCNTGIKCFQSSGCCTYYSMCFMKLISQKTKEEGAIEKILKEKVEKEKLQLDVIVEMSNIFDDKKNRTLIKIPEGEDSKKGYIIIDIGGQKYGLNRKACLSNFLELDGISNFVEYITNDEDKKSFKEIIGFQNMLLGKEFSIGTKGEEELHERIYDTKTHYINISYDQLKGLFKDFKKNKDIDSIIKNIEDGGLIKKKQSDGVTATTDSIENSPECVTDTTNNDKQQELLNMCRALADLPEEKKERKL